MILHIRSFILIPYYLGQLKVRKNLAPLNQMVHSNAPFLLTIIAEEIGSQFNDSSTVTAVELALLLEDDTNDAPEFNQERYADVILHYTASKNNSNSDFEL